MTKLGLVALVVAIGCGSSLQRPADGAAGTGGGDDGGNDGAADAPPAATLMACAPNVPPCGAGRTCILGCARDNPERGVCSFPDRDSCGCGAVLDECETPGTTCLMPACCDYPGVCVTPVERAAICARPESAGFDCGNASQGP